MNDYRFCWALQHLGCGLYRWRRYPMPQLIERRRGR